jgi:hypothetical protein
MTACGTPAWETPFDTVEEFEATAKAKARKGGRGKKDELKAAVLADAKEHGISKRTVERALSKAEARPYTARPLPKPRSGKPVVGIEAARRHYLDLCADPDVDLDAEQNTIIEAFKEIMGKRLAAANEDLTIPDFLKRTLDGGHA